MSITIGYWVVPLIATIVMLCAMLRPYKRSGDYDFGLVFRLFWFLPIAAIWLLYMGALLLFR